MPATFESFGWLHGLVLLVSIPAWWGIVRWGRRVVGTPREQRWRRGWALFVWGTNVAWSVRLLLPAYFSIQRSIPIHLCDLAWMVGGWSLWCGGDPQRVRHQVPILWGFALSVIGYATPAVTSGPGGIHFWTFWVTHWQILAVALVNLYVRGTRPDDAGIVRTIAGTIAAFVVVTVLNLALGTSYFFTGRGKPDNPSPLDLLGDWPLRILWIGILGTLALAAVGWALRRPRPRGGPPPDAPVPRP